MQEGALMKTVVAGLGLLIGLALSHQGWAQTGSSVDLAGPAFVPSTFAGIAKSDLLDAGVMVIAPIDGSASKWTRT